MKSVQVTVVTWTLEHSRNHRHMYAHKTTELVLFSITPSQFNAAATSYNSERFYSTVPKRKRT